VLGRLQIKNGVTRSREDRLYTLLLFFPERILISFARNLMGRIFLFLVTVLLSAAVYGEDSVTIRYLPGYPPPGQSSEWIQLRVARPSPIPNLPNPVSQDVDGFFENVKAVLKQNAITADWQLAIPDAPAIEITIDLSGQKRKLVSCHMTLEQNGEVLVTNRGAVKIPREQRVALLAKQPESYRRHRAAFEKIVVLTLDRARVRLGP